MGGNKATKGFTLAERGKVKTKYSTQKVFWDTVDSKVAELVWVGTHRTWPAALFTRRTATVQGRRNFSTEWPSTAEPIFGLIA